MLKNVARSSAQQKLTKHPNYCNRCSPVLLDYKTATCSPGCYYSNCYAGKCHEGDSSITFLLLLFSSPAKKKKKI